MDKLQFLVLISKYALAGSKIHWQQFCQKLSKSAQNQQSYCKNKKGAVFFKHSVLKTT